MIVGIYNKTDTEIDIEIIGANQEISNLKYKLKVNENIPYFENKEHPTFTVIYCSQKSKPIKSIPTSPSSGNLDITIEYLKNNGFDIGKGK